jgi:hypothetical protein
MNSRLSTTFGWVWHLFRYGVALAVAWGLLAAAPMALTLLGTGLALGLWGLLTLGVFVNNEPLDNPMGLLLMPFLLAFFGIAGAVGIVLGVAGFVLLGILPVCLLTELLYWKLSVRHLLLRAVGLVPGALLLRGVNALLGWLALQPLTLTEGVGVAVGVVIASISVGAAGLTLTLLDGLARLISNRHAAKN